MRYNLRSLQAFSAVARHRSISKAAAELSVTQSAVSHQIRRLSEEIGEKLIIKTGRTIALTDIGRALAERVEGAFAQIEASVAQAVGSGRQTVRLAAYSTFLSGWLMDRLADFYRKNPDTELQLFMTAHSPELTNRVADAFVTSMPYEPGYWSTRLLREVLIAVYAPEAISKSQNPLDLPLITTELEPDVYFSDWTAFLGATNTAPDAVKGSRRIQCSHYIHAIDMARRGLGIALVPDFLAEADLRSGRLARFGTGSVATGLDYHLCVKDSRRNEPAIRSMVAWFRSSISAPAALHDSASRAAKKTHESAATGQASEPHSSRSLRATGGAERRTITPVEKGAPFRSGSRRTRLAKEAPT